MRKAKSKLGCLLMMFGGKIEEPLSPFKFRIYRDHDCTEVKYLKL